MKKADWETILSRTGEELSATRIALNAILRGNAPAGKFSWEYAGWKYEASVYATEHDDTAVVVLGGRGADVNPYYVAFFWEAWRADILDAARRGDAYAMAAARAVLIEK